MYSLNRIIKLVILNQILICYISSFIHKSFTQIITNYNFLYTFDSAAELIHTLSRVSLLFILHKISLSSFKLIYICAAIGIIFSTCIFVICQYIKQNNIFYIGWIINRICVGIISATRDYIMYREIYKSNINIPLIKVLKSFGNALTLISILFLFNKYVVNSTLIIFSSIINLIISIITIQELEKIEKEDKDKIKNFVKTENQTIKTTKINYKTVFIIMLIMSLISMNLLSDQIVYVEAGSDIGFTFKFIGQTIVGFIYALFLKNNPYASASFGLIASLSYVLLLVNIKSIKILGILLYGLIYTVKNTSYLVIPQYITNYSQSYQAFAFIFESLSTFISSLIFEKVITTNFSIQQGYILYIFNGIIGWIIAMFIIYISHKKIKNNKKNTQQLYKLDNNKKNINKKIK